MTTTKKTLCNQTVTRFVENNHDISKNSPDEPSSCDISRIQPKFDTRKVKNAQKYLLVLLYAWLFMNVDPSYAQRTLGAMMAARLLSRPSRSQTNGGMNTAEAIALIQAINSNNRHTNDYPLQALESVNKRQLQPQPTALSNRQLPVPVPVPVPSPPLPVAVVAAAIAALLAAISSGLPPVAAIYAVVVAIALVIVASFVNIVNPMQKQSKQNPLIKKLIIKKTVLPFVIPIPIKKKEKEVIVKYKPIYVHKKEHHKKEHYHHDDEHYDHSDHRSDRDTFIDNNAPDTDADHDHTKLEKIEKLLQEQEQLQALSDKLIEPKE